MQEITLATFNLWNPPDVRKFMPDVNCRNSNGGYIPLTCMNSGEKFKSISSAANYYGCSRIQIQTALTNASYVLINNKKMFFKRLEAENDNE